MFPVSFFSFYLINPPKTVIIPTISPGSQMLYIDNLYICGPNIPPSRPKTEQKPNPQFRTTVGYISAE